MMAQIGVQIARLKMSTLFELTNEYQELLSMMEDPEIDPEILQDTMEAIQGEIEIKADNYCVVIKELEAEAGKWKAEKERAAKLELSINNNIKRMKENLLSSMQAAGKKKLPTEHFNLSVAKNGGIQPMYITPEIADIPEDYLIRKPEPDKEKIRKELSEGKQLGFAHLEERGTHLSIK